MSVGLKRIRGIESVEVNLKEGMTRIQLAAGNTVRIDRIRDAIKGVGLTPKEARVSARGKAIESGGKWIFQIEGSDQSYPVPDGKLLREHAGRIVTIEGVLDAQTDPRTPPSLQVTAVRTSD